MRRLRKLSCLLLAVIVAVAAVPCGVALAQDEITVMIDGVRIDFEDAQPTVVDGRTLVPVRGVFESMGFVVDWDQSTFTATLRSQHSTVAITEGDDYFHTNGRKFELDVAAQFFNGRMMLPFRALIESVGYFAYWDNETRSVFVFTDGQVEPFDDAEGSQGESDDADAFTRNRHDFSLPPQDGRPVVPGQLFGVDINYNPDVIFHGRFYVSAGTVARYIQVLSAFREQQPESIRVFCLLVPSYVEFLPERYSGNTAKQRGPIESKYSQLQANGVIPVNAYDFIAERASDEYLYFRTDHHWTALGAYYAYLAFAEAAGFDPITIYEYIEFAFPNFIGMYVSATPSSAVVRSPDTLYYYRLDNGTTFSQNLFFSPSNLGRTDYRVFLGGDRDLIDFTSSNKNGRTLIVIKDSYANAFVPWAAPHYERVIVIDPRHYNGTLSPFLSGSEDADIVFLSSANTPSYPGFVESMATIVGVGRQR